ncbi:hypothetical protein Mboo_1499 [Methanoregula boonei 6A8]|jgi:hypothetical protein|uniref:Uncharacterized protein n=1 Tax=Methanoregula boonei (strain DSM 21154 / JCM 14090 / 6A8) TaxID=456442 RepID=A7I8F6_METB6|nr:hypothetical protein Mboo_1499 [Methanoregula boonei 6A8]
MSNFERVCVNPPGRWIKARREQYSRLRSNLLSAPRKVHETVTFLIHPEDRSMADWDPELWVPKILDHSTPEHRQDMHLIDNPVNCISEDDPHR